LRVKVRAAVAVMAVGIVAAACSSSKSSSGGTSPGGGTSSGGTGAPKAGGSIVMGTEAEVDGFDPTSNRWDTTGYMYAFSVYDPLAEYGADNKIHPYLAQSITPSADYRTWTITLRPNIKFSNGDPLTADAVAQDLTAVKKAALTGKVYDPVDTFTATGPLTVTVSCNIPWVAFPTYLAFQTGVVFDPVMLKDKNASQHPIGTGPFVLKEWVPGNHVIFTKNPNYWQKGLPYLDSVEFRPIVDLQSRENSLVSNTVQVIHSSDPQLTHDLKGHSGITIINDANAPGQHSQDFYMINTAKPPLDDPILRRAVAYATNVQQFNNIINYGLLKPSDGPFSNPSSQYYEKTGYPTYDLAKAKQLVQEYEQKHGVSSVSFQLGSTNSARALQSSELLQSMWKQAGINTTIVQVQQSQYILEALLGNYNIYSWRQFGEADPDQDYIWWSSTTAAPIGQFALNFARNKDPQIQADLDKARSDPNQADRVAAYKDIGRRFAVDVPYIWTSETLWQVALRNNVHGLTSWTLPDGTPGLGALGGTIGGGTFFMSHVWVS
jgi:peptide/nickel transport system substrate-binding protein